MEGVGAGGQAAEKQQEDTGVTKNVLCLDCVCGHRNANIYQNPLDGTLEMDAFYFL